MKTFKKVAIIFDTSIGYGRSILSGIIQYANLNHNWTFLRDHSFYRSTQKSKIMSVLRQWDGDGIIVYKPEIIKDILSIGLPTITVSFGEIIPGICNITGDNEAYGKMGADYFFNRGFWILRIC